MNLLEDLNIESGYVVSESIFNRDSIDLTHYTLSKDELISYEKSGFNKIYIALSGNLKVKIKRDSEKIMTLDSLDSIYVPKGIYSEIYSDGDYSFLMITFKRSEEMIKNLDKEKVFNLRDEIKYQENKIVSKTLANDDKLTMTLLALDEKQELSTHSAPGDALVVALDGEAKITIDGKENIVKAGESIIMPANISHAVHVKEGSRFQMLLVVSK